MIISIILVDCVAFIIICLVVHVVLEFKAFVWSSN